MLSFNPEVTETYENGVRKLIYRDPDGNEVGVGGPRRGWRTEGERVTKSVELGVDQLWIGRLCLAGRSGRCLPS